MYERQISVIRKEHVAGKYINGSMSTGHVVAWLLNGAHEPGSIINGGTKSN